MLRTTLDRVTDMPREEQPVMDTNVELQQTSILRTQINLKICSITILIDYMLLQENWMTYVKEFKLRKGNPQNPYTT